MERSLVASKDHYSRRVYRRLYIFAFLRLADYSLVEQIWVFSFLSKKKIFDSLSVAVRETF